MSPVILLWVSWLVVAPGTPPVMVAGETIEVCQGFQTAAVESGASVVQSCSPLIMVQPIPVEACGRIVEQ